MLRRDRIKTSQMIIDCLLQISHNCWNFSGSNCLSDEQTYFDYSESTHRSLYACNQFCKKTVPSH